MDIKGIDKNKDGLNIKNAVTIMEFAVRGVIGFLLSRGLVFTDYAPFGIAWSAAGGAAGTVGAIAGYISILHKTNSLKYMAICILVYTAGYIFRDTHLVKKQIFMPVVILICTVSVGFVFVIESVEPLKTAAFFVSEVLISALCSYLYSCALQKKQSRRRKIGIALLIATLILPLSAISVFDISIGRIAGTALIMIIGYFGGVGAGSAAGITIAFAMNGGQMSMVYGICGLTAPIFKRKGFVFYTIAFLTVGVSAMLWVVMGINFSFLKESALSAAIFLVAVKYLSDKIEPLFKMEESAHSGDKLQKYFKERMQSASEAFYELSLIFSGKKEEERQSFAPVFDAPMQKVCKKCLLAKNCWENEFVKTKEALYSAFEAVKEQGELTAEDFPNHFRARCIKCDEFIKEANRELFKVLYRKKHRAQIEESRGIIKRQYGEMAKIMNRLKDEIALTFDQKCEAKISDFLEKNEIVAYPTVYRDSQNHIHIELEGDRLSRLCNEKFAHKLGEYLGFKVTTPVFKSDSESVVLAQKENLKVILGATLNKKKGQKVSGDAGSYYRTEEGGMALILADGMGSGIEAADISSNAIKMAERFHRAKIDMGLALSAINTALTLNSEDRGGFTTLDFMELSLYSGKGKIYKLGSAATYIRHNGKVRKITCNTLPAGVPAPTKNTPECSEIQVYPKDFLIFITDGVTDSADDEWLTSLILNYKGESARELSSEIIASAAAKYGENDDMTVFIAYVDKNG